MPIDYDNFEEFRDPITFDIECDDFDADRPCIEHWAALLGGPLLDVACGTGRMAIRLATQGYEVTGVDVVPEMIGRARQKAAEKAVLIEWIVADARDFHIGRQFPFIFMLGNAFQFFLTRQDQEAMLGCVREHLTPGGGFLFETRNPTARNLYQLRNPDPQNFTMPDGSRLTITQEQYYDAITQVQHYTCPYHWQLPDGQVKEKRLRTALRYVYPQEMEALLFHNGFQIRKCYGSWQQEPLTAESPAMIYVCERREV